MREHIAEFKLYTRVLWLGDNLNRVTHDLLRIFSNNGVANRKSFIVLHWTPSEIINSDIEYDLITMPRCEQFQSEQSQSTTCKYELTPILKYCSMQLKRVAPVYSRLSPFTFDRSYEDFILEMYNNATEMNNNVIRNEEINGTQNKEKIYDAIACQFLKTDKIYNELVVPSTQVITNKRQVYIGGLYPKKEEAKNEHRGKALDRIGQNGFVKQFFIFSGTAGVADAVNLAQLDIKANTSILPDIDLMVVRNNDGCHLDAVMRTFINYYVRPDGVLGVLGPPCSETVEPVAGTKFCLYFNLRITFCNSSFLFISLFRSPSLVPSSRSLCFCVAIVLLFF